MNIEFNHRKHHIRQLRDGVVILEERQDNGKYIEIHRESHYRKYSQVELYRRGKELVKGRRT